MNESSNGHAHARYAVEGIEVLGGLYVTAQPMVRWICEDERAAQLAAHGLRQQGWLLVSVRRIWP